MKHLSAFIAAVVLAAAVFAAAHRLPLPSVPDTLRVPALRADYIALHFWDSLDFKSAAAADTALVSAAMADFLSVMPHASSDSSRREALAVLAQAAAVEPAAAMMVSEVAEMYMFSRQSPLRDENVYAMFLDEMARTKAYPDSLRTQWLIGALAKNSPGSVAADFGFTLVDGSGARLSDFFDLPAVVFFYDPECGHCSEAARALADDPLLSRRLDEGRMRVIAIAPGGCGRERQPGDVDIPVQWVSGCDDGTVDEDEIYVFGEYPSIYLLDTGGRVVLRDAKVEEVTASLSRL